MFRYQTMSPSLSLHLDLDEAWTAEQVAAVIPGAKYLDAKAWGPRLRYMAPPMLVEAFYEEALPHLAPFILYGSGDYHYLSALWLRRFTEPFALVSFDNHPDWDIRPPHWACGSWLSRAIELPTLRKATVWGCGNFELEWPNRLFANHRGIRAGRLDVRAWAERLKPGSLDRWPHIRRETWREQFSEFAAGMRGENIYVTVDMDCLTLEDAATNWENGLFTAEDVAWALDQLNAEGRIVAGDLCGAFSVPSYSRAFQRFAANFDHPKFKALPTEVIAARNSRTLATVWPALTRGLGARSAPSTLQ